MNRTIAIIAFSMLMLGLIGCRTQGTGDGSEDMKTKAPGDMKVNYSHDVHKNVMEKE
jgi:hypothetical protein